MALGVEHVALDGIERQLDQQQRDQQVDEEPRRRKPDVWHVAEEEVVVARAHRAELEQRKGERQHAAVDVAALSKRLDALAGPREQQVALLVRRLPEDIGLALGEQPELDHLARLLRQVRHHALVEERVDGVEVAVEVVDGGLRLGVGVDQARADAEADVVQRRLHGVRVDQPIAPARRHVRQEAEQQEEREEAVRRDQAAHLRPGEREQQVHRVGDVIGVRRRKGCPRCERGREERQPHGRAKHALHLPRRQ